MSDSQVQPDPVEQALFHAASTPLTPAETPIVLELYKIYADSMEKVVSRRQTVHTFFLTANSLLMTCAGLLVAKDYVRTGVSAVPVMLASVAGAMVSLVWTKLSRHYGLLSAGKFKVIHMFERHLPAAPFWAEWVGFDEGRNPSKYQSMATIEWVIPVIFLVVYSLMFVIGLVAFLTYFR